MSSKVGARKTRPGKTAIPSSSRTCSVRADRGRRTGCLRPDGPAFQIRTPIDDHNTAHWYVASYPKVDGEEAQRPEDIPFYSVPVPQLDENDQPRWELLDSNSAQDPAAWITQGRISDRSGEHLGHSDIGIIQFRQMLEENIKLVEQGKDPMNTFRDPEKNQYLWMRTETSHGPRYADTLARQGAATKYSPILDRRGSVKPMESIEIKLQEARLAPSSFISR